MSKNVDRLLTIEEEIADIYNHLVKLEQTNRKESADFMSYKRALKRNLIEEKMIFNSLTGEELTTINDNSFLSKKLENYHLQYDIKNRINKKIMLLFGERELKEFEDKIVIDAISSESKDIFLSFIDEIIDKANNSEKPFLINEKYKAIYDLDDIDEIRLLDRDFHTDKSLYLYSKMYAQANQINSGLYNVYRFSIAMGMLSNLKDALDNNINCFNGPYKYFALSVMRTTILLLNEQNYKELLQQMHSRSQLFSLFDNLFDGNFIKTLEKDRERHKVLSLIPNIPHE